MSKTHMGHFGIFFLLMLLLIFIVIPISLVGLPADSARLDSDQPIEAPAKVNSCKEVIGTDDMVYTWCS